MGQRGGIREVEERGGVIRLGKGSSWEGLNRDRSNMVGMVQK